MSRDQGAFDCRVLAQTDALLVWWTRWQPPRIQISLVPPQGRPEALLHLGGRQIYQAAGRTKLAGAGDVLLDTGSTAYRRLLLPGASVETIHLWPSDSLVDRAGGDRVTLGGTLPGLPAGDRAARWLAERFAMLREGPAPLGEVEMLAEELLGRFALLEWHGGTGWRNQAGSGRPLPSVEHVQRRVAGRSSSTPCSGPGCTSTRAMLSRAGWRTWREQWG
ncbi:MAG: hypothetical protein ACRDJN_14680 [Chloroflexota bacterium]